MQPLLGSEMAAARATEFQHRAAQARLVREAKAARKNAKARAARTERIVMPWRAIARGRAVGKVPTRRPAVEGC